jgi:tellurite resistance protein TerC
MDLSQLLAIVIILVQVIFLEVVLSLDNAAVLGTIVLSLPVDQPVPWPHFLRHMGRMLNPLLGKQRTAGLRVGLLGAYTGQALMLVMASFIIRNPWLQLVGAAYLLKMSVSALGSPEQGEADGSPKAGDKRLNQRGFWMTVVMVELMDLAFSLDNVVVVVSISPQLWLVMFGVALGILCMRFAASLFSRLIEKVPPLATAAYVLVFNIGVELILARLLNIDIPDFARFVINVGTLLLAILYAKLPGLQKALKSPFKLFRVIFYGLDQVFNWILFPFAWVWGKFMAQMTRLFRGTFVSTKI